MHITFYSMKGCGYCTMATELLSSEINNGEIIVVDSKDAPANIEGYPTFTYGSNKYVGYPSSKDILYDELKFNKGSAGNLQLKNPIKLPKDEPIIFYTMNGCGYCDKASDLFSQEIRDRCVLRVNAKYAPTNVKGFPTFELNSKLYTGLPDSKNELYKNLNCTRD